MNSTESHRSGARQSGSQWVEAVFPLALGGLWAAALAFYLATPLNHDSSWYLVATDRMLDGARLYRDIVEVNPPLAFFLTTPPAALARITGKSAETCFTIYFMLLVAGSIFLTDRALKCSPSGSASARRIMLIATLVALVLIPMPIFGEREHFLIVLAAPYVFLLSCRLAGAASGTTLAIGVGAVASFGFLLKPYFVIALVLLEAGYVITRGSPRNLLRPELACVFIIGILYLVFVALQYPEYFTVIAPYAKLTYAAYAVTPSQLLRSPLIYFVGLLLIGYVAYRISKISSSSSDPFALFSAGLLVAYLAQSKGWLYQFMPVVSATFLLLSSLGLQVLEGRSNLHGPRKVLFLATTALALGMLLYPTLSRGAYRSDFARQALPIVRQCTTSGVIHALTSDLWVGFPLVNQSGLRWGSSYPAQWLLPGVVNQLSAPNFLSPKIVARLRQIEQYIRDNTIDDLRRWPPDVIIVDLDSPFFMDRDFDYVAYFQQDPRFGEIWRGYRKTGTVLTFFDGPRRLEVWCRHGG